MQQILTPTWCVHLRRELRATYWNWPWQYILKTRLARGPCLPISYTYVQTEVQADGPLKVAWSHVGAPCFQLFLPVRSPGSSWREAAGGASLSNWKWKAANLAASIRGSLLQEQSQEPEPPVGLECPGQKVTRQPGTLPSTDRRGKMKGRAGLGYF